jgi:hypothetical protein
LYHNPHSNTPLGTNFNTKLVSVFLVSCHWNNEEIKSAKVIKGQNYAKYLLNSLNLGHVAQ